MERVLKFIAEHVGFAPMVMATNGGTIKVNWQVIAQTIIIAGIIGAVQFYLSTYTLQHDIKYIQTNIGKIESRMEKIEDNLFKIKIRNESVDR